MKEAFVVHMEGKPETILLSANGRIVTEPMDMPEWAHSGLALAKLAERTMFYQTRLDPQMAAPILESNIINYEDLNWVATDEDGEEIEVPCNDEYRQNVLAQALGIDRETGEIENVITERYIDREGQVYTAEEIVSKEQADQMVNKQAAVG